MDKVRYERDVNKWIRCIGQDGGVVKSQTVEANLLFDISQTLKRIEKILQHCVMRMELEPSSLKRK